MSYGIFNWWWGENLEWKFLENLKITKVANEGDGGTADLSVRAILGGGSDSVGFDNRMVGKSLEWLSINEWMGENLIPESMIAPFQKHPCLIFYGDLGLSKAVKKISNPTRIQVPYYLHMTEKEFLKAFHFSDSDGWWVLKDMDLNQAIAKTLKKNSPELYQKFQDYEVKS